MSKRIVILCDGTWNEPERKKGQKAPSNVLKMTRAIQAQGCSDSLEQVVFYDRGIGTGTVGWIDKYIAGATGLGISRNITECYQFLANNYVPGDEIFCFGFSRGAYTVRSLCGMMEAVGLLAKQDLALTQEAYQYYRTKISRRATHTFDQKKNNLKIARPMVKFIGVWDTVGALGVPIPILKQISHKFWVGFHNTSLSDIIENAFHAVAIDERRGTFAPALWTHQQGQKRVQQVWFAGSHQNVGGGFKSTGLSDMAFYWLANRAKEYGLILNDADLKANIHPEAMGDIENSYTFFYKVLEKLRMPALLRNIGKANYTGEMIHESVLTRIKNDKKYTPINILGDRKHVNNLIICRNGRDYVARNGIGIPIFRERKLTRVTREGTPAKLVIEGQPSMKCEIIDCNDTGGAKLRLLHPLKPGENANIELSDVDQKKCQVVWSHSQIMGVRFIGQ